MSVAPSSTNGSIKDNTFNDFSIRTLVRSADVADNSIRPLGIEPVVGSLDDTDLITREAADADVVLNFVDVDHLPAVKAILKGLSERRKKGGRARPILIHTSGTGVLTDSAYGAYASEDIYYDKDVGQLSTLAIKQPTAPSILILSPSLIGRVDTYVVIPPMIYDRGTDPVNRNMYQIPLQVRSFIRNRQVVQLGQRLNIWNKVHVTDLAHFFVLLLERSLQEPQTSGEPGVDDQGHVLPELPKNGDASCFVENGEFTWVWWPRRLPESLCIHILIHQHQLGQDGNLGCTARA